MKMMRAGFVFWCLIICVKGDTTGYDVVNPTPVVKSAIVIQTTNALSPLKVNNQGKPEFFTTGVAAPSDDVLVNPTPVLPGFEVTEAAMDTNILVSPSLVIIMPNIMETNAGNPLDITSVINVPIIQETNADSLVNPSPIVNAPKAKETMAGNPINPSSIISNNPVIMETNADVPVSPSSLINMPVIKETNADQPLKPSSLINMPIIMETIASNPLNLMPVMNIVKIKETNADSPIKPSLVTKVPIMMETIASDPFNSMPVMNIAKVKETNADNPVKPSPVKDLPTIQETSANKPLFFNKPENSILTTMISEEDVKPTPVVIVVAELETTPIAIGLINNDTPEPAPPSTGSLIEPSQIYDNKSPDAPLSTDIATPNLESQKPIDVTSVQSPPKVERTINPCICSYYTDLAETTIPELLSEVLEDALIPQIPEPEKPKKDVANSPITIFQRLINLQVNYVINNFPVYDANSPPFYIQPR